MGKENFSFESYNLSIKVRAVFPASSHSPFCVMSVNEMNDTADPNGLVSLLLPFKNFLQYLIQFCHTPHVFIVNVL